MSSINIFCSNLFPRKWFRNQKYFHQKIVDVNFWFEPIPEEMILQPQKRFGQ